MTTYHYIAQLILCLLIVVCFPVALMQRKISRLIRLALSMSLIFYGLAFYLYFREVSGIVAALIGLWALFFVTIHSRRQKGEDSQS